MTVIYGKVVGEILITPDDEISFSRFVNEALGDMYLKRIMDLGVMVYFDWSGQIYLLNGKTFEDLLHELEKWVDILEPGVYWYK